MTEQNNKKSNKLIIIAIVIAAVIVCSLVAVGVTKGLTGGDANDVEDTATSSSWGDPALGIDESVDESLKDYRNVLIFGLDNKNRSDIILVASMNKKTETVKLITVWRDTYMQLNDEKSYYFKTVGREFDFFKCNHAYFKGGKYVAIKEFNRHMDLNCRESIGLNWDTTAKLVDAVGGIDVDVTQPMFNMVNRTIRSMYPGTPTIDQSGNNHLTGNQAVAYLRVRKDATAVQRSERNQDVFVQIFEKMNNMSTSEKMNIFDQIADDIDTNMSREAMTSVISDISSYKMETCGGWPNNYKIMTDKGCAYYYYVPDNLTEEVTELHSRLFNQNEYKPSEVVTTLSDKIDQLKETDLCIR